MTEDPGTVVLRHHSDTGNVTVLHADPVIRVSVELLDTLDAPWWDGEVLVLDTAALYRYRPVDDRATDGCRIFERIGT
jgi:hypothetical protein